MPFPSSGTPVAGSASSGRARCRAAARTVGRVVGPRCAPGGERPPWFARPSARAYRARRWKARRSRAPACSGGRHGCCPSARRARRRQQVEPVVPAPSGQRGGERVGGAASERAAAAPARRVKAPPASWRGGSRTLVSSASGRRRSTPSQVPPGFEVTPGEQALGPPVGRGRRPGVEFVAIGGDDDRDIGMRVERDQGEAHGGPGGASARRQRDETLDMADAALGDRQRRRSRAPPAPAPARTPPVPSPGA